MEREREHDASTSSPGTFPNKLFDLTLEPFHLGSASILLDQVKFNLLAADLHNAVESPIKNHN